MLTCEYCAHFRECVEEACEDGCELNPEFEGEHYCLRFKRNTNADRIRAMSDEKLAKYISALAYGRETPWSKPFETKFCKSCPTVKGTLETGEEMEFCECDFTDGKCPHGDEIEWWLKQPAESEANNENTNT